jgi:hypothetical protein
MATALVFPPHCNSSSRTLVLVLVLVLVLEALVLEELQGILSCGVHN